MRIQNPYSNYTNDTEHQNELCEGVAALYCRLSKEDIDKLSKGDDSESIHNQRALLISYAQEKRFTIYDIYIDDDLSGMFDDRPDFERMICDAEKGLFNTIICKHQSRFTRDLESVEKYIHKFFVEWEIRFISIVDNIDTNIKGNKKARQINGLVNEWYIEDLSENIRAVFKQKMKAGQFLGSFACYGYMKDPCDKHKLVIDEEAAEVVRLIFKLSIDGYGAKKIANHLTKMGLHTPTQYKKDKGLNFRHPNAAYSNCWAVNTIRKILSNETYIGTLTQGRERKVSYKSRRVVIAPKDQWVVIKNNHPAIIDKETFYTVQSLIGQRRITRNIPEHSPDNKNIHILAGKLKCQGCGGNLVRNGKTKDKKVFYLSCSTAKKTINKSCTPHFIRQDIVENLVYQQIQELINKVISSKGNLDYLKNGLSRNGSGHALHKIETKLTELDSKIKEVQRTIAKSYSEKLNGIITEKEFLTYKSIFDENISNFLQQKQALENEYERINSRVLDLQNLDRLFSKHSDASYLLNDLLNDFIDTIKIGERNKLTGEQVIEIDWKF